MPKLKVAFFWYGFDGRYGVWRDGLWRAMHIIGETHDVRYFDVNEKELINCKEFNPDIVLFWEAPCSCRGQDADMWFKVCRLPYKKILLFAGGPLEAMEVIDFDLVLVESQINEDDCERQGIQYMRAFGINDEIFFPKELEKKYDGMLQATCAGWKRQGLFAEAMKDKGILCGRDQKNDPQPFIDARRFGTPVLPEQPMEEVANLINQSHCVINTASFWGGGQRATLEAMACGTPVIAMDDSPKNREFVDESGFGMICRPTVDDIRKTVNELKERNLHPSNGRNYILSKWTARHYAENIMKGIYRVLPSKQQGGAVLGA